MKNPVFKARVAALFEKVADPFGQDPFAVAAANPNVRGKVHRGLALERGAHDAAAGAEKLLQGGAGVAEKVLSGGSAVGGKFLGGVSGLIERHPSAAIGTALMAPILSKAFNQSQHRHQDELMNAYHDPSRAITASLEEFLEKKAADHAPFSVGHELLKGVIGGAAGSLVALMTQALGSHLSSSKNIIVDEPKRKALLENLFKSDPVIKDSLARHPDSKTMLLEAYGTMTKFAPSLSLDINATRSFLREAVLGGSGVNYATIKNLVDTEKSIGESKPRFGGGKK